jgi:hypothetical protein
VVDDFALARPSLDEVFLTLTGRPAGNGTVTGDQEGAVA